MTQEEQNKEIVRRFLGAVEAGLSRIPQGGGLASIVALGEGAVDAAREAFGPAPALFPAGLEPVVKAPKAPKVPKPPRTGGEKRRLSLRPAIDGARRRLGR